MKHSGLSSPHLKPRMTESLIHTVALPHLHLKKIVDQICSCGGNPFKRVNTCINLRGDNMNV